MMAFSLETVLYAGAIGLVAIGVVGLVMGSHLFRMLLALAIAEAGGNLLLVLAGFRGDAVAPILTGAEAARMVDPVPQALVLTAIVIGVGIQALAVGVLMRVYKAYGTLDLRELHLRMEVDIAAAAGIEAPGSLHAPAGERPLPPAVVPAKEAKS
ncbi:MAG: NADH-quinone oxidoreductase subunit K [Chromatiaceae bacterium]